MTDYSNEAQSVLSEAVRLLRQRLGLTQAQFAAQINRSEVTVGRYETNRPPTGQTLRELSNLAVKHGFEGLASIFRRAFMIEVFHHHRKGEPNWDLRRDTIVDLTEWAGNVSTTRYAVVQDLLYEAEDPQRTATLSPTRVEAALNHLLTIIGFDVDVLLDLLNLPDVTAGGIEEWASGIKSPPVPVLKRLADIADERGLAVDAAILREAQFESELRELDDSWEPPASADIPVTPEERAAAQSIVRLMRSKDDPIAKAFWDIIEHTLLSAENALAEIEQQRVNRIGDQQEAQR